MKTQFNDALPEAAQLLFEARVNRKAPMPEQASFVSEWPFTEMRERIQNDTGIMVRIPGLLLYGPTGTGKSTSLFLIVKKHWEKWRAKNVLTPGAISMSGGQLAVELIEASLGRSDRYESAADMIEVLSECQLFVLDELDKMNITHAVQKHFAEVVRRRHLNPHTFFFATTNATPSTMLAKADKETRGPLRRRIIEMTVAVNFGDCGFRCSETLSGLEALFRDRAEREALAEEEELREIEEAEKEKAERLALAKAEAEAKARADADATAKREQEEHAENETIIAALARGESVDWPKRFENPFTKLRLQCEANRRQRQAEENAQAEIEGREACAVL